MRPAFLALPFLAFLAVSSAQAEDYFVCGNSQEAEQLQQQIRDAALQQSTSEGSLMSAPGYLSLMRGGFSWSESGGHLMGFLSQFSSCLPADSLGSYKLVEWLGASTVGFVSSILLVETHKISPPEAPEETMSLWLVSVEARFTL